MKKQIFEVIIVIVLCYFSILHINIYKAFESAEIKDVKIITMPTNCNRFALFTVGYNSKIYQKKVGRGSFCEKKVEGEIIKMKVNEGNNKYGNIFFLYENTKIESFITPFVLLLYLIALFIEYFKPSLLKSRKLHDNLHI